jgi:NADPH:quinone reductase-like Zn-dependent oxidoreductase
MRAYEITAGSTRIDGIRPTTRPDPKPGAHEILVRVRAASLNYRDLMIAAGHYMGGIATQNTVALSDGAGEVVEVGNAVTRFKVGDRVMGTFFRDWVDGKVPTGPRAALGAQPTDGVLSEWTTFDERDAVSMPGHLSFEAAATLPCAAVTAWHALMSVGQLEAGQTVLALGTGGVSIFALQIARMVGARVIITSSSDAKLERARSMGASDTINYRATPDWEQEVLKRTGGRGADLVVEVGGAGTLGKSMQAVAPGGKVTLIGVLTGRAGDANPYAIMAKYASLHGIFVGNRTMFEALNRALQVNAIQPVVDKVFDFNDTPEALRHMQRGDHFGKVVITL